MDLLNSMAQGLATHIGGEAANWLALVSGGIGGAVAQGGQMLSRVTWRRIKRLWATKEPEKLSVVGAAIMRDLTGNCHIEKHKRCRFKAKDGEKCDTTVSEGLPKDCGRFFPAGNLILAGNTEAYLAVDGSLWRLERNGGDVRELLSAGNLEQITVRLAELVEQHVRDQRSAAEAAAAKS
jgi:hypothetical protein